MRDECQDANNEVRHTFPTFYICRSLPERVMLLRQVIRKLGRALLPIRHPPSNTESRRSRGTFSSMSMSISMNSILKGHDGFCPRVWSMSKIVCIPYLVSLFWAPVGYPVGKLLPEVLQNVRQSKTQLKLPSTNDSPLSIASTSVSIKPTTSSARHQLREARHKHGETCSSADPPWRPGSACRPQRAQRPGQRACKAA